MSNLKDCCSICGKPVTVYAVLYEPRRTMPSHMRGACAKCFAEVRAIRDDPRNKVVPELESVQFPELTCDAPAAPTPPRRPADQAALIALMVAALQRAPSRSAVLHYEP